MSAEEVDELLEEVRSNRSVREEFSEAETPEEVVEIARDHGYDVTLGDYETFRDSHENNELSDEELENVAGGKSGSGEPINSAARCGMSYPY